jgi:hypothetical protein
MPSYASRSRRSSTRRTSGTTRTSGQWSSPSSRGSTSTRRTTTRVVPGYAQVGNQFEQKIASYRTLFNQAKGPAKFQRPAPATLSSFANWIDKGAVVQRVSAAQCTRWSTTGRPCRTAAAAKAALTSKFGRTTIKAVMKDKSGGFLVATSPQHKGRKFSFPR